MGLIKGYYWQNENGAVVYDRGTDVGTGGMYTRASIKGPIRTLPEVPGVIVYKSGHVGVYAGSGSVIEAKGFANGVVRTELADGPWTDWFACPFISYAGYEEALTPPPIDEPYTAVVVTKSSPLNIWRDSTKQASLLRVSKGDTLAVTGYATPMGWLAVEKNGVTGVADGQYLAKVEAMNAEDDADDKDSAIPFPDGDDEQALYFARVKGIRVGLNLRVGPSLSADTLLLVPNGATVEVMSDQAEGGFAYVRYGDVYGYVTWSYLVRLDDAPDAVFDVRVNGVTGDAVARVVREVPGAEVREGG